MDFEKLAKIIISSGGIGCAVLIAYCFYMREIGDSRAYTRGKYFLVSLFIMILAVLSGILIFSQ